MKFSNLLQTDLVSLVLSDISSGYTSSIVPKETLEVIHISLISIYSFKKKTHSNDMNSIKCMVIKNLLFKNQKKGINWTFLRYFRTTNLQEHINKNSNLFSRKGVDTKIHRYQDFRKTIHRNSLAILISKTNSKKGK